MINPFGRLVSRSGNTPNTSSASFENQKNNQLNGGVLIRKVCKTIWLHKEKSFLLVVFILFAVLLVLHFIEWFVSAFSFSPLLTTQIELLLVVFFAAGIVLYLLRPPWIRRAKILVAFHLPTFHKHIKEGYGKISEKTSDKITVYRSATSGKKLRLLLVPLVISLAVFLIFQFRGLFIPPKILTSFPAANGAEAPLDSKIEIIFSENVIRPFAEKSFVITPPVSGTFSWESGQKLIFTPKQHLERSTTYHVSFHGLVVSNLFIPLTGTSSFSFQTIGNPKVLVASPQDEAPEDLTPITVVFDRPMIPLTTATNSAVKKPAFTVSPGIRGKGTWLGTTAYQFQPSQRFRRGTTYTITVPKGLKSQDGGVMNTAYVWHFSGERPHVLSVSPFSDYHYSSPTASVAAFFSQDINASSVPERFSLYDSKGNKIAGTVRVQNNIVGFYPSSPLTRREFYHAELKAGIQGTEGPNGTLDDYTWNFRVTEKPSVLYTTPSNGEKNITEENQIQVAFISPMDQDSFTGNVQISPAPASDPSLYFYSYNGSNTLSIGTYLGRSQTYTITIGTGVKDQYGVPLDTAYTFSFTTAPYQPSIGIYPFNTYFGAFNQSVTQRIVAQVINATHVDYAVYKLDTAALLDLYRRRYDYTNSGCGTNLQCENWQDYDPGKLTKINSWSKDFQVEKNTPTQVVSKITMPDGSNLPSGFYFLSLSIPQGVHDNMVMIVSKSTLTVKKSDTQIFTWAVNESTGATVSGMNMKLIDDYGNVLTQGTSNSDGVFMKDVDLFQRNNLLVIGQNDADLVLASSAWSDGINTYDFGLPNYYSANEEKSYGTQANYKTFLVLDRPIYRPGQTVYFKGVIRKDNDGAYENLPPGEKVSVVVSDAMNRPVFSQQMPITTFGSFAGNLVLGKDANLGYYTIHSTYQGNSADQSFQVEEYRKPDLAVSVTPSKTDYFQGETADVSVNAAYYFGAPVTNAPVTYTVDRQDYVFQWSKDWRFEFGDPDAYWDHPWWYYTGQGYSLQTFVTQGSGTTDSQGNFDIRLPLDISQESASQQLIVEATVQDVNNQAIAASQTFTVHKAALYAGVHPSSYANTAGKPAAVDIVTVDDKGNEVPNTPVAVTFYKRSWTTVREQNPDDGYFYYTSKASDSLVSNTTVTTDGQGYASADFTPSSGGTYKAVVTVSDANGNQNVSGTFLWVAGSGFDAPRENTDRIVLTTDKPSYFVGDTLNLFVATPFASTSAKTLLTAERGSVLDYKIVNTSDVSNNFQMNVSDRYAPNAYIGAVLVKPGSNLSDPSEFKIGYTPITVTNKKKQIITSITTNQNRYEPRDTLRATIQTKDGTGNPVSSEIAVGLVDKAVWDLAQVQLPDIYKVFYEPRSLGVTTSQLLTMSIDRINATLNLGAKGGSGGGCFTGDTPVLMKGNGSKKIQDIRVGDTVLTRESDTSPTLVPATVLKTYKHTVDRYLIINGRMKVTPIHELYVNGHWIVAGNVIPGEYLLDQNNHLVKVFSVAQVMGKFTVYNLETQIYHTYFADGFYVHNQKGGFDTTRSNFPDTAYWNPYVKTDSSGVATVSIPLPDSLTTWKLVAIANSATDAFGESDKNIIVSKNVLIRPFLPRFLAVGDTADLGAIVVNTSGQDETITAKISGSGIGVLASTEKQIVIKDGAEEKITWPTTAKDGTSATITLSVFDQNGNQLDGVKSTLPVTSYSVPETVATSGQAKDTAEEQILLPKDVDTTQGSAQVSFSPSLGAASFDAYPYLFSFPYDSVIENTGRFLSAVSIYRVFQSADIQKSGNVSKDQLKNEITGDIQSLNSLQHTDGGWGWFVEFESNPYITSYALQGLLEAKNAGFTVSDQTISRAKNYLSNELSYQGNTLDLDTKVFIISVLSASGENMSSFAANLYTRRFELSIEARARLAIVMKNMYGMGSNASGLFHELLSLAKLTATTAHWEDTRYNYHILGSDVYATANVLEALTVFDPKNPFIPEAIRYLLSTRTDGHWASTHDTASVIRAIAATLLNSSDQNLNERFQFLLNGKKLKEGTFGRNDLLKIIDTQIPVQKFVIGKKNSMRFTKSGTGNLYYNINLKYFLPFSTISPLDQGIVIIRKFVDDKGNELPMEKIAAGSEAWVRLTIVVPADRNYVVVDDPLPAGLESENNSLKNVATLNAKVPPSQNKPNYFWYFSRREFHDDRTTLFADFLPVGVYEVSYRVRATTPGRFHYPPAQAYELYTPDVSGHSSGDWITVSE